MIHVGFVASPHALSIAAVEVSQAKPTEILGFLSIDLPSSKTLHETVTALLVRLEKMSTVMIREVVLQANGTASFEAEVHRAFKANNLKIIDAPYHTRDALALSLLWADISG